jgi:hypothetical protein
LKKLLLKIKKFLFIKDETIKLMTISDIITLIDAALKIYASGINNKP